MKKFKLFALAALAMLSINTFAATVYVVDDNGIRYSYENTTSETADGTTLAKAFSATVIGVKTALGEDKAITIPASFTALDAEKNTVYFKVVAFGSNWSNAGTGWQNVTGTLEKLTVNADNFGTSVGANALTGLTALKEYTVIDSKAARTITDCAIVADVLGTIEKIDMEKTAQALASAHFKVSGTSLKKLTEVKLPSALTAIPDKCFEGSNITSITLPATVTSIGSEAFKNAKITSITIPEAVTSIGASAFAGSKITSIDVPAAAATLGDGIFASCADLETVTGLDGTNNTLPTNTFANCEKLASITLPENILAINTSAFSGCTALASVTIEGEFTAIGNNAFKDCESLASIDLSGAAAAFTTIDATMFAGCKSLATITLPESIATINNDAFKDCVLTSLDLSGTAVTALGTIFGTITKAEDAYSTLTSITLPEGLTSIATLAFNYCTGLTEITLPASLVCATGYTEFPTKLFYYCTGLKTVNYEPGVGDGNASTDTAGDPLGFNANTFLGCTPYVKINTNNYFFQENGFDAPLNAKFLDDATLSVTTVADNGTSGKYFAKYCPVIDVTILPADLTATGGKLYTVYEDQGAIYLARIRVKGSKYQIPAYTHIIVKSDEEATYTFTADIVSNSSVDEDQIFPWNAEEDVTLEKYQTTSDWDGDGSDDINYITLGYKYLYALTNKAPYGFGFTEFTGTTLKKGGFFLPSTVAPAAGGRLNVIWVDDEDATGISSVAAETAQEGDAYNLAGQKVGASYKGIIIKNGKKVILK